MTQQRQLEIGLNKYNHKYNLLGDLTIADALGDLSLLTCELTGNQRLSEVTERSFIFVCQTIVTPH